MQRLNKLDTTGTDGTFAHALSSMRGFSRLTRIRVPFELAGALLDAFDTNSNLTIEIPIPSRAAGHGEIPETITSLTKLKVLMELTSPTNQTPELKLVPPQDDEFDESGTRISSWHPYARAMQDRLRAELLAIGVKGVKRLFDTAPQNLKDGRVFYEHGGVRLVQSVDFLEMWVAHVERRKMKPAVCKKELMADNEEEDVLVDLFAM